MSVQKSAPENLKEVEVERGSHDRRPPNSLPSGHRPFAGVRAREELDPQSKLEKTHRVLWQNSARRYALSPPTTGSTRSERMLEEDVLR